MSGDCEWTLAMIKPDAVRAGKAEEIKQLILLSGFTIIAEQKIQLTPARAEDFYLEHYGKSFFTTLVDFMSSGPIWALVLSRPDGIKHWRACMGPTNTLVAREQAPHSLRALFGTDGTFNATHGSDSPKSAAREIKFYFPNLILEPLLEPSAAQHYITSNLHPALSKALTALAREKPSAEKFEAITFLAHFLLANNPNKPRIITPDAWDPAEEDDDDEAEFVNAKMRVDSLLPVEEKPAAAPVPEAYQSLVPTTDEPLTDRTISRPNSQTTRPRAAAAVGLQAEEQKPTSAPEDTSVHHTASPDSEHLDSAATTKVQAAFRSYRASVEVDEIRTAEEGGTAQPPSAVADPTDAGEGEQPLVDGLPFGADGFEYVPESEAALIREVVAVAGAVELAVDSGMSAGQAEGMAERVSEQVAQLVLDMVWTKWKNPDAGERPASVAGVKEGWAASAGGGRCKHRRGLGGGRPAGHRRGPRGGGSDAEVEEARAVATAVAEAMVDGVPGEQTVAVAQEVAVEMAQATEDANLESEEGAAAGELASVLAAVEDGMDPAVAEGLEAAVLEDVANIVEGKVAAGESVQEATIEALAEMVDELRGIVPPAREEGAEHAGDDPGGAAAEAAAAEREAGEAEAATAETAAAATGDEGAAEPAEAEAESAAEEAGAEAKVEEKSAAPEGGNAAEEPDAAEAAAVEDPAVAEAAKAGNADESPEAAVAHAPAAEADPPAEAEPAGADERLMLLLVGGTGQPDLGLNLDLALVTTPGNKRQVHGIGAS
ncbi:MAG: hypothetical protein WDW38_000761 [Sanguina aurantia]